MTLPFAAVCNISPSRCLLGLAGQVPQRMPPRDRRTSIIGRAEAGETHADDTRPANTAPVMR
jgi:hypothetical protein